MRKVLLVHGDRQLRQLLRLYLIAGGLEPLIAEHSSQTAGLLVSETPGLLALDASLPWPGELDYVLRGEPGETPLPLVFLTSRQSIFERVERLGSVACLTPPSLEAFINAIARGLKTNISLQAKAEYTPEITTIRR